MSLKSLLAEQRSVNNAKTVDTHVPISLTALHNARRSFGYIGSAQGRPFFNTEVQAYETDV